MSENQYKNFRFEELISLFDLHNLTNKINFEDTNIDLARTALSHSPFLVFRTDISENRLREILSRAVTIKSAYRCICRATSVENLITACEQIQNSVTPGLLRKDDDSSFSFAVKTHGKKLTEAERIRIIELLVRRLGLSGKIALKTPEREFSILTKPLGQPPRFYFGAKIFDYDRAIIKKLSLKTRGYIGPTSTDARLALLMANQALARPQALVYDPFAGTGGVLVAAAARGALAAGSDIDGRVLKGAEGRDPRSNSRQYGLPRPELLRGDAKMLRFRGPKFDAVVCDPPYGNKAGAWTVARINDIIIPEGVPHYQKRDKYGIKDLERDLFRLGSDCLKVGGRLVYLHPVDKKKFVSEENEIAALRKTANFRLLASSLQRLYGVYDRMLLTFVKTSELTEIA